MLCNKFLEHQNRWLVNDKLKTTNDHALGQKRVPGFAQKLYGSVRNKAIEIANALLAEGSDEQKAITIATAKAEEWATNRNLKIRKDNAPKTKRAS